MWIFVLILLVVIIVVLFFVLNRQNQKTKVKRQTMTGDNEPVRKQTEENTTCDTINEEECIGCGEECPIADIMSEEIVYYDDEELDKYKKKAANDYTDEETEEFRSILYTMLQTDIGGWVHSLQLRGINLPDAMKDEVFLLINEK
ncbi:MAG: phospholipase [Bacteroidaceae bacterium]|nr:phospholipase [Bacteroidaceae bacterium]